MGRLSMERLHAQIDKEDLVASVADSPRGSPSSHQPLETVGVAAIPDAQRKITPFRLFVLWAMASASALTPIVGQILFNFGLGWMITVIVAAWLLAFIPAGLFSEMGREMPLTAVQRRRTRAADFFEKPKTLAQWIDAGPPRPPRLSSSRRRPGFTPPAGPASRPSG